MDSDVLALSICHVEKSIEAGASSVYTRLAKNEFNILEIYIKYMAEIRTKHCHFFIRLLQNSFQVFWEGENNDV